MTPGTTYIVFYEVKIKIYVIVYFIDSAKWRYRLDTENGVKLTTIRAASH